jgi:hypothetical protein
MNIPESPAILHPDDRLFSTERLQLAIYLHASQRLPFLRCEGGPNHKIKFVFGDPESFLPPRHSKRFKEQL